MVALNGVMPPSGQVNTSAPLSVVKTTIVLSASPMSSRCLRSCADAVIHLRHAGLFDVVVVLGIHHRLVLRRQVGEDVHPRGVVPDEERLAVLLGLVHEVAGTLDQHVVEGLHVVLGRAAFLPVLHVLHVRERRQAGLHRRSSACRSCPSAAARSGRPCRSPSNAPGCAGRSCRSSPGDNRTSRGPTWRRGGTGSRRIRRSRAPSAGTCSGRRGGSCRTGRWHSPAPSGRWRACRPGPAGRRRRRPGPRWSDPVRRGISPVMKFARPAVQLASA